MHNHTDFSPQCRPVNSSLAGWWIWLFSTVHFQMCPQMMCIWRSIVTLVAFVWLFSRMCFQMCLQIAPPRGGIFTLVAFIWVGDIASHFLCILYNKVIIIHLFFHFQCVLCCAQMVASNWVKFIFDYWFPIIKSATFSMANFHFLDRGMSQQPQSRKEGGTTVRNSVKNWPKNSVFGKQKFDRYRALVDQHHGMFTFCGTVRSNITISLKIWKIWTN